MNNILWERSDNIFVRRTVCQKMGHKCILHRSRPVYNQWPNPSSIPFQSMMSGQNLSTATNVSATTTSAPHPHRRPVQPAFPVAPSAPTDPASIWLAAAFLGGNVVRPIVPVRIKNEVTGHSVMGENMGRYTPVLHFNDHFKDSRNL